jgi:hypothetical protein
MSELSVTALAVATADSPEHVPVAGVGAELPALVRAAVAAGPVPADHLTVRVGDGTDGPDVSAEALAALGAPGQPHPLVLVRSGPLRDPLTAALAGLVHESGWAGEDLGLTHLEELGGSLVFGLLDWALPAAGGTVLVCDEPLCGDDRCGPPRYAAVGLRLRRGDGPLRVLGCGEGPPDARDGELRFTGVGPCDAWLALHAALAAGRVADGTPVLLHTRSARREGWLRLAVTDVAALRLAGLPPT